MRHTWRMGCVLVLGLALTIVAGRQALAGDARSLEVQGYAVASGVVSVKIANTDATARSGAALVKVVLADGVVATAQKGVEVAGLGTTSTSIDFGQPVGSVISVSITDDVSPF